MRKADDRTERFRHDAEEIAKRKQELEERFEYLEKCIAMRDQEIMRLNNLYEGG